MTFDSYVTNIYGNGGNGTKLWGYVDVEDDCDLRATSKSLHHVPQGTLRPKCVDDTIPTLYFTVETRDGYVPMRIRFSGGYVFIDLCYSCTQEDRHTSFTASTMQWTNELVL